MASRDKVWIDELGQYLTIPTAEAGILTVDPTTGLPVNPFASTSTTVPCALSPLSTVWSLRVTSADDSDTVTVYETLDGVETSIGTLNVSAYPAAGAVDSYQRQFDATYRCDQAGSATLTVEVM